jgi:hypothetical protein
MEAKGLSVEFSSFAHFASHLAQLRVSQAAAPDAGLQAVATHVENAAKAELARYQGTRESFLASEQLAEETNVDRESYCYDHNDPLFHPEVLTDSYCNYVSGSDAWIGSTLPPAAWMEIGTSWGGEPRPVLGPAICNSRDAIQQTPGGTAQGSLPGGCEAPEEPWYENDW